MSLVVEDGTGLSNADSYVALADVTAYLTKYASAATLAAWSAGASIDTERACRNATHYLDAQYGSRLPGFRINETM